MIAQLRTPAQDAALNINNSNLERTERTATETQAKKAASYQGVEIAVDCEHAESICVWLARCPVLCDYSRWLHNRVQATSDCNRAIITSNGGFYKAPLT